jgi:hypothetical protein
MVWSEDVPVEVVGKVGARAALPKALQEWSAEVVGRIHAMLPFEPRRAVGEMYGRRIVVDLRGTTFGSVLVIALGDDVVVDAPEPPHGPYRGGAPALRGAPRIEMRRRTTLGRVLAFLRLVREVPLDDPGLAARASVRSDAPVERVRALLARPALRDGAIDLFDRRYVAVGVARRGSLVDARLPEPVVADLDVDGLSRACHAMSRVADAIEETGAQLGRV